jgi:serine protease inhibitor
MKRLNRLVVCGVGLAVCVGVVAGPKSLVAEEVKNENLVPAVVAGTNRFAVGLYGQLARQNPESNLFFSPYSVYGALLMAAEGTRGETLAQMAGVLHFPEHIRNSTNMETTTWEIHIGLAALNRRLTAANNVPDSLRRKVTDLESKLTAANKEVTRLGCGNDFNAIDSKPSTR